MQCIPIPQYPECLKEIFETENTGNPYDSGCLSISSIHMSFMNDARYSYS
jgi:hypothetical protein